jgi:hypothetical protein
MKAEPVTRAFRIFLYLFLSEYFLNGKDKLTTYSSPIASKFKNWHGNTPTRIYFVSGTK